MTASSKMPLGSKSVAIRDPSGAYAVLTKTKVSVTDQGYELHFLRPTTKDEWLKLKQRLEASGAYGVVKLVSLSLKDA